MAVFFRTTPIERVLFVLGFLCASLIGYFAMNALIRNGYLWGIPLYGVSLLIAGFLLLNLLRGKNPNSIFRKYYYSAEGFLMGTAMLSLLFLNLHFMWVFSTGILIVIGLYVFEMYFKNQLEEQSIQS